MKKALFILIVAFITVTGLKAQKPVWNKIGETNVDFKINKDIVKVSGEDAYKALRIKTTDATVHIESLQVVYQDGEPESIPIRFDFKANTESRDIELEGRKRKIKEIDFVYRTVPNWKGDHAHIEILGLK